MAMFGIRDALKSGIKRVFGDTPTPPPTVARPPAPAAAAPTTAAPEAPAATAPESTADDTPPAGDTAPADDTGADTSGAAGETAAAEGAPMTYDEVWELLDEMVRPALQSDGGDITLVKVENNDVHVQLVGACSTCPSSIMTMKMGVEALLREEFPQMRELVQVGA